MKFQTIPIPLQRIVLVRLGLGAALAVCSIAMLIFFAPVGAVPFLVLSLLSMATGIHIYRATIRGQCFALHGTVLTVEQTAVLRRPKAILVEAAGHALHLTLRNRHRTFKEGSGVVIYVMDDTPIYEWKGLQRFSSYLTIALDKDGPKNS